MVLMTLKFPNKFNIIKTTKRQFTENKARVVRNLNCVFKIKIFIKMMNNEIKEIRKFKSSQNMPKCI